MVIDKRKRDSNKTRNIQGLNKSTLFRCTFLGICDIKTKRVHHNNHKITAIYGMDYFKSQIVNNDARNKEKHNK